MSAARRHPIGSLYVQVVVGVAAGVLLGHLHPAWGVAVKPLGDGFIKLVKMLIAPIIFATIVTGVAHVGDLRKVGRLGAKALIYFEVMTTLALAIGLVVGKIIAPGRGLHVDMATLDTRALETYASEGRHLGAVDFLLGAIPSSFVDAFAKGDTLQVLLVALLFGAAASSVGAEAKPLVELVDRVGRVFFAIVAIVMRLAPLGAFGAMGFTIGKYGLATLVSLGALVLTFYVSAFLFVAVVLGAVARWAGVGIFPLLRYLRDEILIVLGTSSSESALPRLMAKLEALGCDRAVVGLVVPTGYSFNLDGTSIYLTLATLFVAQATGTHVSLGQELALLGVLMLTSKGAAAVTGSGFVILAATLSSTGVIPVAGLALLLGIDRFMSEARAITNLCGNAVATIAIAKWERAFDATRANEVLRRTHTV